MTRVGTRLAGAALLAGLSLCGALAAAAADGDISFKKRGDEEKRFVAAFGTAIVKAAHKTAKKIELVKYEYGKPKTNRTELTIKSTTAPSVASVTWPTSWSRSTPATRTPGKC